PEDGRAEAEGPVAPGRLPPGPLEPRRDRRQVPRPRPRPALRPRPRPRRGPAPVPRGPAAEVRPRAEPSRAPGQVGPPPSPALRLDLDHDRVARPARRARGPGRPALEQRPGRLRPAQVPDVPVAVLRVPVPPEHVE